MRDGRLGGNDSGTPGGRRRSPTRHDPPADVALRRPRGLPQVRFFIQTLLAIQTGVSKSISEATMDSCAEIRKKVVQGSLPQSYHLMTAPKEWFLHFLVAISYIIYYIKIHIFLNFFDHIYLLYFLKYYIPFYR